ncbi:MAG: class I SAM-dependent methyltransferase [Pseudomonadota bacterium]
MSDLRDLETLWTGRLRKGERPTAADLRDHLLATHSRNTGFSETLAGGARDAQGRTSYEWLADIVDPTRHKCVLDLACGSGLLLEICERRFGDRVALIGVDMSADELALAKKRLPGGVAELRQGLAQDLNWLADGAVDAVLCHWALTLMDPVDQALSEACRIIRPGGVFAAIVDGDMAAAPQYAEIHEIVYGYALRAVAGYRDHDLGDPRVRDRRALAALAQQTFGAGWRVRVDPGMVRIEGSPRDLARKVSGFFYASFVLSGCGQAAMLDELEALFSDRAEGGQACFTMPLSRLVVTRG